MSKVVIYAIGSAILVDIEESIYCSGLTLVAGICNREGKNYLSSDVPIYSLGSIPAEITSLPFLVPCFTPGDRQEAAREAQSMGFSTPFNLVDPTVSLPRTVDIEGGAYINAGCTLGAASVFEGFILINRGASVGHHARIGRFVSIGPGAVIAGRVTIGKGAVIGAGAVVLPDISIGENAVVGAGAVVTRDVPDFCMVLGNPARVSRQGIKGFKDRSVE